MTMLAFPLYETMPQEFDQLAQSAFKYGLLDKGGGASYSLFKHSKTPSMVKVFNTMSLEPNPLDCLLKVVRERFICIPYASVAGAHLVRNYRKFLKASPILSSGYHIIIGLLWCVCVCARNFIIEVELFYSIVMW